VIKLPPIVPDELPAGLRQSGTWSWPWFYPDGSQILRAVDRAVDQVRTVRGVPGGRRDADVPGQAGRGSSGEQQTKTKTALGFFARSLKATADA
jgi:hypothetical protein